VARKAEIQAFEVSDKTNAPSLGGIVFVGSSSIRLWKTLNQDFPGHPVLNRGFGGSEIMDSIYFADRIIIPYRPRLVVLYAGANDINAGKAAEQVFGDFCALVAKIHAVLPQTRIAFISIAGNPARWAQVDRVREANRRIERYCATDLRLVFIDVFSHMLGPDGLPRPDLFVEDRLHLNEKGYAIWRELVKLHLLGSTTGRAD
jgi:lysophospholipase L1-like esterase